MIYDGSKLTELQREVALIVLGEARASRDPHPFVSGAAVFAVIDIESSWREAVRGYDGLTVGLMQVLPAVAEEEGLIRCPPEYAYCSVVAGMRHLSRICWHIDGLGLVEPGHGREPVYVQAYNVGVRGYQNGRRNWAYWKRFEAARSRWRTLLKEDAFNRAG